MTAKQRQARARFKKVVQEASKLRKKNKKLTQAQAVKQAWAIQYSKEGKSRVGKVQKTKVKAKRSKKSGEMHTDTKSHNVNIRVVSGVVGKHFKTYKIYKKHIIDYEITPSGKKWYIVSGGYANVPFYTDSLTIAKKYVDRLIAIEKTK